MNLQLSLIGKWFKMSDDLIKTEDYRLINPYWVKRLLTYQKKSLSKELTEKEILELCEDLNNVCVSLDFTESLEYVMDNWYLSFKPFKTNTITLGYPKKGDLSRITQFKHAGIEIRTGNPEWGAEPDKLYFVIKHGKKL